MGVVARGKNPVLFGYFFGPRRSKVPNLTELQRLTPADATLVGKFGHLGIVQGRWSLIGRLNDWDRANWPMPAHIRNEELTGRSFLVWYDDDNQNHVIREDLNPTRADGCGTSGWPHGSPICRSPVRPHRAMGIVMDSARSIWRPVWHLKGPRAGERRARNPRSERDTVASGR